MLTMPEPLAPLEQFKAIVFADVALQEELRSAADRSRFIELVVMRAREHGCALDADAVTAALDAGARAWMLRWIER
jgi:hypothetical protein